MTSFVSPLHRLCLSSLAGWIALLFSVVGCSGTVHPPAHPIDPVRIYLADYGRHSSVVLPDGNDRYVEWAFGDWDWFALGQTKWTNALQALIHSRQSTLARRVVARQLNDESLRQSLEATSLARVVVSSPAVEQLLQKMNAQYEQALPTEVHSDFSHMNHVKDTEAYWGLHNCNHITARWLRELGCKVDGMTILSKFKVEPESHQ